MKLVWMGEQKKNKGKIWYFVWKAEEKIGKNGWNCAAQSNSWKIRGNVMKFCVYYRGFMRKPLVFKKDY